MATDTLDQMLDSSAEDPPADLWVILEGTGYQNRSSVYKYLTDEEEVRSLLDEKVQENDLSSIKAIWHLQDGFWVPFQFGFVMQPCPVPATT